MSEKITTLHPENDSTIDVYPNIKADNIPSGSITATKLDSGLQSDVTWTESVKDHIVQNNNTTEIGGNMEVDGTFTANSGEVVLDDTTIDGALGVTGNINTNGNIDATGHIEIQGAGAIHGDVNLGEPSGTTQKTDIHGTLQVHNNLIVDSLSKLKDTDGNEIISKGQFGIVAVANTPVKIDVSSITSGTLPNSPYSLFIVYLTGSTISFVANVYWIDTSLYIYSDVSQGYVIKWVQFN